MKKHFTLLVFFTLIAVFSLLTQTRSASGKIKESSGESIPGVDFIDKGTLNGTEFGIGGSYSLPVSDGAILVFSSIGYTPEKDGWSTLGIAK